MVLHIAIILFTLSFLAFIVFAIMHGHLKKDCLTIRITAYAMAGLYFSSIALFCVNIALK